MKMDLILGVMASLAYLSNAYPAYQGDLDTRAVKLPDRSYKPNIPGMVRSPCPGTNTLANHGFIHRNGKNITRAQYSNAFVNAFGISSAITKKLMRGTFDTCRDVFNNGIECNAIDLSMLHVPHRQEHDASITRDDATTIWNANGDNNSFNQSVWQRSLDSLAPLGTITHLNAVTANTMRLRRVEQSRAENPNFRELQNPSLTEHAYYLSTMNDPALGNNIYVNPQARLDWVNHWFVHEELPTALGWKKPALITSISIIHTLVKIAPTIPVSGASTSVTATTTDGSGTSSATVTASSSSPTDAASSSTAGDASSTSTTDSGVTSTSTTDPAAAPTP